MMMTERVARLRQQSLTAVPAVSTERAELMTDFYKQRSELTFCTHYPRGSLFAT